MHKHGMMREVNLNWTYRYSALFLLPKRGGPDHDSLIRTEKKEQEHTGYASS